MAPPTPCPHRWMHVSRTEVKKGILEMDKSREATLRLRCILCSEEMKIESRAAPRKP